MKTSPRRNWRRALSALALSLAALAVTATNGIAGDQAVRLNFLCATNRAIPPGLQALLPSLMKKYGDDGVAKYGDRAATVPMGEPAADVYFIPLSCGATGNCSWGVLAPAPDRVLGVMSGAVIRIARGKGWPVIEVFTHDGAGQGELETLVFRVGAYHRQSMAKLEPNAADENMSCVDNEACCPAASNLTRP